MGRLGSYSHCAAFYFCVADTFLILQCLYYSCRHRHRDRKRLPDRSGLPCNDPEEPLLNPRYDDSGLAISRYEPSTYRRQQSSSLQSQSNLVALVKAGNKRTWLKNTTSMLFVCLLGILAWVAAWKVEFWTPTPDDAQGQSTEEPISAEILGYFSAACYLGYVAPTWKIPLIESVLELECRRSTRIIGKNHVKVYTVLRIIDFPENNYSRAFSVVFHAITSW